MAAVLDPDDAAAEFARIMKPFLDSHGRLRQFPAKRRPQEFACSYLASKFEPGVTYSEREVNELLSEWHTFRDWALLRRMLYDLSYLERDPDGKRYWLADPQPVAALLVPDSGTG